MLQKRPSQACCADPSDRHYLPQTLPAAALFMGQTNRAELNPSALGCWSQRHSLWGKKVCRPLAIWYLHRLVSVESPAFCSAQKTTENFRQTFHPDQEQKTSWQGRETKAPWSQPCGWGCTHPEFNPLFQFLLSLWDEEGRESRKHTRINRVLLFATTVTELGGQKSNQDEQQDFSQDKISPFGVSVYFK